MSTLRLTIAMSLDGFVAGPGQSTDDPLGVGRPRLRHVRTVASPGVTHLTFARSWAGHGGRAAGRMWLGPRGMPGRHARVIARAGGDWR